MKKDDILVEFIKEHKGYDDLQALKAAYQTKLFIRSLVYTLIIGIIISLLGYMREVIITFACYKLYRQNAGGIHIKGHIKCFVISFITIFGTILLALNIDLNKYVELVFIAYITVIWALLVPQGTSQRPIRKAEEKRQMKINTGILILLTLLIRLIDIRIYKIALWSLVITSTCLTPVVYRLFNVKHDRV